MPDDLTSINMKYGLEIQEAEQIYNDYIQLSNQILDRYLKHEYDGLTEKEKHIWHVDYFLGNVNNGGFHQYFSNAECNQVYVNDLLDILDKLKDDTFAPLVRIGIDIYNSQLDEDKKYSKLDELDNKFYKFGIFEYAKLYKSCLEYYNECGSL